MEPLTPEITSAGFNEAFVGSTLRLFPGPRTYMKLIRCPEDRNYPLEPQDGALRFGPGFYDVRPMDASGVNAVMLPIVRLRVATPPVETGAAFKVIAEFEEKMALPVIEEAARKTRRIVECPGGVDKYWWVANVIHDYFYNRGMNISNIMHLTGGNLLVVGKRNEVGVMTVHREWRCVSTDSSGSVFEGYFGMAVYGNHVLGVIVPGSLDTNTIGNIVQDMESGL